MNLLATTLLAGLLAAFAPSQLAAQEKQPTKQPAKEQPSKDEDKDQWDMKRLEAFEKAANGEIDGFEKDIRPIEDALHGKKVERVLWAGDEKLGDANYKEQRDTGFKTLWGYEKLIERRTAQQTALSDAYKAKAKDLGVEESDVPADTKIEIEVPLADGTKDRRTIKAGDVPSLLDSIETELEMLELEKAGVAEIVAQYDRLIKEIEDQIVVVKNSLKDLRQQVKLIAATIKVTKDDIDLDELNKAVRGEDSESDLGDMIAKYEASKTKFKVQLEVGAKTAAEKLSAPEKKPESPYKK